MTANEPTPRAGHPYYMHDAIYAQPGALRLVTRGQGAAIEAAAARLRELDHLLLTGVGTSWHAALVGELLFARLGGLGLRALLHAHRQADALDGAEEVAQHRHGVPGGALEEERRPARAQHAVADLGHLQARRHRRRDALQAPQRLELAEELAQVRVVHAGARLRAP